MAEGAWGAAGAVPKEAEPVQVKWLRVSRISLAAQALSLEALADADLDTLAARTLCPDDR